MNYTIGIVLDTLEDCLVNRNKFRPLVLDLKVRLMKKRGSLFTRYISVDLNNQESYVIINDTKVNYEFKDNKIKRI